MDTLTDTVVPLFVAVLLGALVGIERESKGRWAGLRTHMLVSLASASFSLVGITRGVDSGHIHEGIIVGMGFIGGGTILKLTEQMEVKGLTTASSLWLAAAVGIASSLQCWLIALVVTGLSLFILNVVVYFERKQEHKYSGQHAPSSPNEQPMKRPPQQSLPE